MNNQSLLDAAMAVAILKEQQKQQSQQQSAVSSLLASVRQQQAHQEDGLRRILQGNSLLNSVASPNSFENDPITIANIVAAQRQRELAKLRQDAIVNEAYKRGREEALLSLIRAGAIESLLVANAASASTAATSPATVASAQLATLSTSRAHLLTDRSIQPRSSHVLSILEKKQAPPDTSKLPAKKRPVTNEDVLKTLGNSGVERREKNMPYFDASSLSDPDPATLKNRKARGGVTETFPEKLHRMLLDVESSGETDIVGFFPHGRAFAVHNPTRFVSEILPKYFRQSRLSSFQRQLNLYGFTRISSGPDTGGYYHELFLKGRPALSVHMRRVGVPQGKPKDDSSKPAQPTTHPDFYKMNPVGRR